MITSSVLSITLNSNTGLNNMGLRLSDSTGSFVLDFEFTTNNSSSPIKVLITNTKTGTAFNLYNGIKTILDPEKYRVSFQSASDTVIITPTFEGSNWTTQANAPVTFATADNVVDPFPSITAITPIEDLVNGCDTQRVSVTTNTQVDKYKMLEVGAVDIPVTSNPFEVTLKKVGDIAQPTIFTIYKDQPEGEESVQTNIAKHSKIVINSVSAVAAPNGDVSITPNLTYSNGLDIGLTFFDQATHSVDGVNYVSNASIVTPLSPGDYTYYVKDAFGCIVTKPFTVASEDISNFSSVFIDFPKANGLHFAKKETIDMINVFPVTSNTLSFQEGTNIARQYKPLIKKSDPGVYQFRSTYTSHIAYLNNCQGLKNQVSIIKKSNNSGAKDSREARLLNFGSPGVGVIGFVSGKEIYNPDTGVVIGYQQDSNAADFYQIGGFIEVLGRGFFEIKRKELIPGGTTGLYIDFDFTGVDDATDVIINYSYAQGDYDIFEIVIDHNGLEGEYWLSMEATLNGNTEVWNSEVFNVKEYHECTYEIIASNTENNEVNYQTGIKHIFNLEYDVTKTSIPEDEIDIFDTDNSIIHLEGRVKDVWKYEFSVVSTATLAKLKRAFSMDELYINREKHVKIGSVESERLGSSNMYTVIVNLAELYQVFNTNTGDDLNSNVQGGFLENSLTGLGYINDGSSSPIGI